MKKERMKVLTMVEEGKISVEEATKLLEALSVPDGIFEPDYDDMEDKVNAFSRAVDNFTRDIGDKIGETYKGMEPRLKKATRSVVEKTANIVDDIAKSLQESLKNLNDDDEPEEDDAPREN